MLCEEKRTNFSRNIRFRIIDSRVVSIAVLIVVTVFVLTINILISFFTLMLCMPVLLYLAK